MAVTTTDICSKGKKNIQGCRQRDTTTTTTNTTPTPSSSSSSSSSSSTTILLPLLLLLLPGLLSTCNAVPISTAQTADRWRHPCSIAASTSSSTATSPSSFSTTPSPSPSLPDIMGLLKDAARDAERAARDWKNLLTVGVNSRLNVNSVANLSAIPVGTFFSQLVNSQSDVTEMLVNHYVVLSQMYILAAQCRVNSEACDTRGDSLLNDTDTTLHRVLSTLCQVDTFLTASGHPMPEHQVPDKDQVLEAWMTDLPRTCDGDDTLRVVLDYVIARDSHDVLGRLYLSYLTLHGSMSNTSD